MAWADNCSLALGDRGYLGDGIVEAARIRVVSGRAARTRHGGFARSPLIGDGAARLLWCGGRVICVDGGFGSLESGLMRWTTAGDAATRA